MNKTESKEQRKEQLKKNIISKMERKIKVVVSQVFIGMKLVKMGLAVLLCKPKRVLLHRRKT